MECIFDNPLYQAARESRLRNLFRCIDAGLLTGKRVLEVGCGTGELGQAFVAAGCRVLSVDGRPEYIEELGRRFPGRQALVMDLENWVPAQLGRFDMVLCFGLLYHLARPAEFLASCSRLAPELYLETVVSDAFEPVCPLVLEEGSDQACSGMGCRPSPAWLNQTLSGLGFEVNDISGADANWGGSVPSVFDWTP
ncbi:MAG TPA: class I SAM-dependent methyltransferase, partial [Bryobacteraceae bacterium]|nr:class I SAM-dependent methyltransferase [Bryobacteraceae bacterium]